MPSKPVRMSPYNTFTSRNNSTLNNVVYGNGASISAPSPPSIGCQDTDMLNIRITVNGDKKKVRKRPGASIVYALQSANGLSGVPQGMTFWQGAPWAVMPDAVNGDTLVTTNSTPNSGASGSSWTGIGTGPYSPRTNVPVKGVINGLMFMIGGSFTAGGSTSTDVQVSADGVTWYTQGSVPFPSPRWGFFGCVYGGKIYVCGGFEAATSTYKNDVWSSPDGNAWTQVTASAAWAARASASMLATSAGMYMLGGGKYTGAVNEVWFTPDGLNWSQIAVTGTQWAARLNAMVWWYNNTIYIGGGAGVSYFNDVWSSTNGGISWTPKTASAWPGGGMSASGAVVYNNKLWALGGYINNAPYRTSNVYSSSDGATWNISGTLPQGAFGGIAAIVYPAPPSASPAQYKTIYMMGGDPASGIPTNNSYRAVLDSTLSTQFPLFPPTFGKPYDFATFNNGSQLLVKTSSAMYVVSDGSVSRVWDSNYPATTARGLVVLGGFAYVMDLKGVIHCCAINDPFTWPALNVLGSSYDDDYGMGIVKVLNYLVAFGQYSMEVYYDAGNPTGSPLSPYLAASVKIGCYSGDTIVPMDKTVTWLGQTHEGIRRVYTLDGLTPVPVSTPNVDKMIAQGLPPSAYRADYSTYNNHTFYMLHISSGVSITFVYDLSSQQWTRWAWAPQASNMGSAGNQAFTYGSAANLSNFGQNSFFLDVSGNACSFGSTYQDNGSNYYVVIQTERFDGDNDFNKYWGPFVVVGDKQPGNPQIFYTDDDYQTWGPAHTVDLSTNRPMCVRNGRSRRRAITYIQLDSNPIGLDWFEFPSVEQGGDVGG